MTVIYYNCIEFTGVVITIIVWKSLV